MYVGRHTVVSVQVSFLSVWNKAVFTAVYQCWYNFIPTLFLSSGPALLWETVTAAVDQGHGDTDKLVLMQLCIGSQRFFFKAHIMSCELSAFPSLMHLSQSDRK